MNALPLREAARAVVLDAHQRVLLLCYEESDGFWATPGGSLEPGEDHLAALLRELGEELGIEERDVELGAQLAERSSKHAVGGHEVCQVERYYLARFAPEDIDTSHASQSDNIRCYRWWTLHELQTTHATIYPVGLGDLITSILSSGPPRRPVVLG
ncbi:NUDIX domain-containing protein [Streptomyces sp. WM6378]|uniref:NUDIX domain-containing protein n=1 Tax=Streptomyces sp. WM6378 TaxID=1415557 RepID=UPI0006C6F6BF|nr:NUDIX domain-containing protein [Streptomyces sp. WM6378]KOU43564.1 hypothetical protein ADK54_17365 [Streptomyces sp. WM6378]